MSLLNAEQVTAAYRSNLDSFAALSAKTFEGVERVIGLNLNIAKATLSGSSAQAKELFSLREPSEFLQYQAALAQPTAESLTTYARHLADIANDTRAEIVKFAETHVAEGNKKFSTLIDTAAKNAPTGSESGIAILKASISAANSAYESLNRAAKHLVELTESNVTAATNATVKAAGQVAVVAKASAKKAA